MQNAVAFANNDVVTIAWSYGRKPEGCMGFAVYRIDQNNKETALPSHAVFPGETIRPGQTTEEFPIQKFYWKDVYARLVAEKTGSRTFRYKIVPLAGDPGSLAPMTNLPHIVSNKVTLSAELGPGLSAYFNRGLISTQRVSRAFQGKPSKTALLKQVATENNPLRLSLAGDMIGALSGFVDRAKAGGTIYAALYELGDEELLNKLTGLGEKLQIVLSNSAVVDPKTKETSDANDPAREALEKTAAAEWNRIMPNGHIGHNKFLVYVDKNAKPAAVLFGSTNWTPTGLCTQTNNTVIVDDADLAARYLAYWKQLAADTKAADGEPKSLQAAKLRTWDTKSGSFDLAAGVALESWFSPNTPKPRSSKKTNEKMPVDLATVAELIGKAQHAILFLAFDPGTPSITNWIADALRKNKDLFVRGCVTNRGTAEGFYYQLVGMTPPKRPKGDKTPRKEDGRVLAAEALDGGVIPQGWLKEILSAGFAIIHDKIVVIDPFAEDCVVMTGSHNLGYKASYDNDENLAIITGNKNLAVAYATHVLDVYDHFAWRYRVKQMGAKGADQSLNTTPDGWLDQYFDAAGEVKTAQLKFWMQATV